MYELTLNDLSVHYIVDHSVPCQLWCLVAFGIYYIFPNFLTLQLVLVRERKHKKFFLLGIICDLSRRSICRCQCNLEKVRGTWNENTTSFLVFFLMEVFTGLAVRIGPCSAWKEGWYFSDLLSFSGTKNLFLFLWTTQLLFWTWWAKLRIVTQM